MRLTPNYAQNITLKANAKKIINSKCVWHQICTKLLLWKQMLRKSLLTNAFGTKKCTKSLPWRQMLRKSLCEKAFDVKYVQNRYFKGKCLGNYHCENAFDTKYVQNSSLWREMLRTSLGSNAFNMPNMYKTITLKANAKEIITLQLHLTLNMYKIMSLWMQMLRKLSL